MSIITEQITIAPSCRSGGPEHRHTYKIFFETTGSCSTDPISVWKMYESFPCQRPRILPSFPPTYVNTHRKVLAKCHPNNVLPRGAFAGKPTGIFDSMNDTGLWPAIYVSIGNTAGCPGRNIYFSLFAATLKTPRILTFYFLFFSD